MYDGHGGHEVAEYCSLKLPDFLKTNENFKKGNYKAALEEAFIEFDATLIDRSVVEQLKRIASTKEAEEDDEDDDEQEGTNEVKELFDEAHMPIEDLVAKYATSPSSAKKKQDQSPESAESGGAGSALPPHMKHLKNGDRKKPVSPFLRAKTCPLDLGEGSGSNKHIRFNEDGSVIENGDDKSEVKEEVSNGEKVKSEEESNNGEIKTETELKKEEEAPKTPVNNGETNGKAEIEDSPEGSEKENKDTNIAKVENQTSNGADVFDDEGNIVKQAKGKGKGKGKGKSKGKSEDPEPEVKQKKEKKSADEIYDTLKKAEAEEGDEDSEDSDDMEYGEAEGLDEEDSDEELDDVIDDEEDSEESDDDEVEDDDEDDGEEDYMSETGFNEEPGNDSGCTAVLALLAGTTLYVANAGDSR